MMMMMMMIMSSYISGDYLSFQGDSQKERPVAMVTSPWQPRTSNSPLHCFKFRYLVYGREAHHLEVFLKYRGKEESRIWTASQDDVDVWKYGQVPVGALHEFQVNKSQRKIKHSFSERFLSKTFLSKHFLRKKFLSKQFLSNGRFRKSATSNRNVVRLDMAWGRRPANQND